MRKAQKELYIREGTLTDLRELHFDSTYLPKKVNPGQRVYVAVLSDLFPPVNAVLVEEHLDHIIYRYAGSDDRYKTYQGNTYLVWWVAAKYRLVGYKYFDLGGSKVKSIEDFKRRLSTSCYPLTEKSKIHVLFKKVEYHIKRRLNK